MVSSDFFPLIVPLLISLELVPRPLIIIRRQNYFLPPTFLHYSGVGKGEVGEEGLGMRLVIDNVDRSR